MNLRIRHLILCSMIATSVFAHTVRVKETPGGPQIHVDDKTVSPRFFFGSMNSGKINVTDEWTNYSFRFTPGDVKGTGTLHFRFSHVPGKIWFTDVRIQDAQTGEDVIAPYSFKTEESFNRTWNHWPTGDANTVGTIETTGESTLVTLKSPPDGKWPDFHLYSSVNLSFQQGREYICTFNARAMPACEIQPALYSAVGGAWNYIGGPPGSFLNQVALARDAAVNLVSFSAPNCWTSPEEPIDWKPLDDLCNLIISVNNNVLLVPRVTANAPSWWIKRHPEARMQYDGTETVEYSSVSDRNYRRDVCAHLERICKHLCERFPDNFAGIHPCGQNTGEWFYRDTWSLPLSGYDNPTKTAFREWLKSRGDPAADTADAPLVESRRAHPYGLLRDPGKEKRLIDFARFQQQEMADHVLAMANACRRGTSNNKLVLFFYGYIFEFAPVQNGAPTSGHYALSSVLKSKDIDILCSPISYIDREWIGTAPCMTAAESVRISGKLWLNEDDSRTFLDPRREKHVQEGGLVNLEQTQQVMLRNTAQAALRGFGTWWMDLPAQGWFNDARIWQEMIRLQPVDNSMLTRSKPFTPDVAVIVNEDSMCHLPGGSAVMARPLIYESRKALGRSGTSYGQYLLEDAIKDNIPAKLHIFLSTWALSPAERSGIAVLKKKNTTRVWCYAPGYLYPDKADIAGINETTGFEVQIKDLPSAAVNPSVEGKKLGLINPWGPATRIQPLFSVKADDKNVLATYSDGSAAVAIRHSEHGIDIFMGVPEFTPELVRAFATIANVHLFTDQSAAVWNAENYISFQAHKSGPLIINTGNINIVADALDGKTLGTGPELTIDVKQGETRVLKY